MPGTKRKAEASTSKASSSKHAASPAARASSKRKPEPVYMDDSDNNDEFDDEEDLLDSALHGTGSAALPDDLNEDDDDEDEDDDKEDSEEEGSDSEATDAASQDEIELASDADDFDDESDDEEQAQTDGDGGEVEIMSDEDMDGGFEDLEANGAQEDASSSATAAAYASRKASKSALYAIPTLAEVQGLKETGELFKNNVFKLKVDEMLPEVRPAYSKAGALELVLRRLHQLFQSLEPIEPLPVGDAIKRFQKQTADSKVNIPFPDPAPKADANYKLGFDKPAAMHLVGSWALKSAAKRPQGIDVDVAVVMPAELFQQKDYVNFRYFHKKAFYLAALAHAIQTAQDEHDIHLGVTPSFSLVDADPRRPILVLSPIRDKSETDFSKLKCNIRIHPAIEPDTFKPIHLGPLRSNVRVASDEATPADAASVATPRYNAAILADMLHLPHLVYLHSVAQACPAFADACLLLKTWAFQRGFGSGGRLNPKLAATEEERRRLVAGTASLRYLLTMILAHLLQGEEKRAGKRDSSNAGRSKLSNSFSSYQLFRGVMDWLAKHDFRANPVFMKPMPEAGLASRADKMPRAEFSQVFDRVLVDPSGMLNLLAFVPTGSVDLLQYEARRTFDMLNDPSSDHFDALFLQDRTAAPFTFDEVARIDLPLSTKARESNGVGISAASPIQRADFGNSFQAAMIQVSSTASRALEGRAKLVALMHPATGGLAGTWRLNGSRPAALSDAEIGVVLDGEQAWRMVEHGPSSQETEQAERFRAFWGKMSELRRFKDGRVLESVVWPVTTQASRWAIPRRILSYVLYRHHAIHESQIHFVASHFDSLLEVDSTLARTAHVVSTEEKGFTPVQTAFDQLSKDLRALESLPLSIIAVSPASPGLRGTSTFVPAPLNLELLGERIPDAASYLPVHDIVITFEGSGKWPNELAAIQAMKAAFFERMCAEIGNKMAGTTARVVFNPNATSKMEDQCSLELVLPSGFAFRASVMHSREKVLLERILADRFESAAAKRRARKIVLEWQRRFETLPLHHSYIASMGHRFASFGTAVRLTKRWFASQMLSSPAVPEELIELVCAAAYLSPEEGAPASAVAGLLRILRLLANWRWKEEPLMVPIQAVIDSAEAKDIYTFPADKRTEVETAFKAARGSDPSMTHRAWFVATETDVEALALGRQGPVGGVADGIRKLAQNAVSLLESATSLGREDLMAVFTPSTEHYDFVIALKRNVLPRYSENVHADPSVWGSKRTKYVNDAGASLPPVESVLGATPKPGFDSAEAFLALLRGLYSDSFRLYHDCHGGSLIGGLFNPSLERERDFKVGLGFSSQPTTTDRKAQVKLNRAAIMAEIERLGEGLVERVELRNA